MTLNPESIKSWKKKLKKLENKTPIYFIGGGYGALQVKNNIAFKNKLNTLLLVTLMTVHLL